MTIKLSIRRTILWLAALICAFITLGVAMPLAAHLEGREVARATFHVLNVKEEGSLPTLFSTTLLAIASTLLFVIARIERERGGRDVRYWRGLGVIFAYLAIDETAQLHEMLNRVHLGDMRVFAMLDGFAWVWFYGTLVALFALAYSRFLLRLPRDTAIVFLVSGACFVGGALGIDIIGAHLAVVEQIAGDRVQPVVRGILKALLMYSGVTLFIWCLLHHLRTYDLPIRLRFAPPTARMPS